MIYNFSSNDFEGPLDLLLHLVRSSKMDIYDINIESITKQYLDIINNNEFGSVDDMSDYLVMAAELIHLKSKSLIKSNDEELDEEEYEFANKEDLEKRLQEYENIKKITDNFKELEENRSNFYTKEISNLSEYKTLTSLDSSIELDDLINAFNLFLQRQKLNKPLNTKITKKELSVKERTYQIKNKLKTEGKCSFTSLFDEITRPYVIVTFLSVLEMSKNDEVLITQDKSFGEIMLEMK